MNEKKGQNYLFLDVNYIHKVETQTPEKPKDPLTPEERAHIEKMIFKKCRAAYIRRFKRSGLKNSAYDYTDLEQDAWIHFHNIMNKFDKSAYPKDAIGSEVIEGKKKQKTVEWFFYNYYCRRLNLTAKENRDIKNKVAGNEQGNVSENIINSDKIEEAVREVPELVSIFKNELSNLTAELQDYLKNKLLLEIPLIKLKEMYPDFKSLNEKAKDFVKSFRLRHSKFAAADLRMNSVKDFPKMRKKRKKSKPKPKAIVPETTVENKIVEVL